MNNDVCILYQQNYIFRQVRCLSEEILKILPRKPYFPKCNDIFWKCQQTGKSSVLLPLLPLLPLFPSAKICDDGESETLLQGKLSET
jgi:hypothetical protein